MLREQIGSNKSQSSFSPIRLDDDTTRSLDTMEQTIQKGANPYPIFGLTVKSDPIVVCPVHDLWLCDCGLYANPGSNPYMDTTCTTIVPNIRGSYTLYTPL
jgi:hypothetical protein